MKRFAFSVLLSVPLFASAAIPQITSLSWKMVGNRRMVISYTLDRDAIVTADVLTNAAVAAQGVSVGYEKLSTMTGDVNRVVSSGVRRIYWDARTALEGMRDITTDSVRVRLKAWTKRNPPDVMVLDIREDDATREPVRYYEDVAALPGGLFAGVYRESAIVMKRIHATGRPFVVGAERPAGLSLAGTTFSADVTHTNDYFIGVFEVTQQQYYLMTGKGPSRWNWTNHENPEWHPAASVDWWTARTNAVPVVRARTGVAVELPTESQWEFAAYGGYSNGFWPMNGKVYDKAAQNDPNCEAKTAGTDGRNTGATICGSYPSNPYGLYDVIGNISEICLDAYVEDPSAAPGFLDGAAYRDDQNGKCVVKGGDFNKWEHNCFIFLHGGTDKTDTSYYYGLRLAAPLY